MAVTQLLRRTSATAAQAASLSAESLLEILDAPTGSPEELLDLDWAPHPLEEAFRALGSSDDAVVISRACEGASVLNLAFPRGPDSYQVYSDIKFHSHTEVRELACLLAELTIPSFAEVGPQLLPDTDSPASYLQQHAMDLVSFYARAAIEQQVVVTWWD